MKLFRPKHLRIKKTSGHSKLKKRAKYFKDPLVQMLIQGVSKNNEKFKNVKITLDDLKTPLF